MYDKYVIFSPFTAGYCNVLLSYEIAFSIAHITNRKIVIPPTNWCVLIDERTAPKESWQDIWQVLDINAAKEQFDIIPLLEFEDLKSLDYYSKNSPLSWTGNITSCLDDVYDLVNRNPTLADPLAQYCLYSSANNTDELALFANGRPCIDLNVQEKYINIPGNLFGHFWYSVFAGSAEKRNALKQKINKSFVYKEKYKQIARELAITPLNAVHIRNPKQLNFEDYPGVIDFKDKPELLLDRIQSLFKNYMPLYVSTDIVNRSSDYLFSQLRNQFQLRFLSDFNLNLQPLEAIAVDQLVCANADLFYGTYYSTFTKRINVLRGVNNKQANDSGGFNKNIELESADAIPWIKQGPWQWHMSSMPQWTYE